MDACLSQQINSQFVPWNRRCTRVENPGDGVPDVFCQNPKGGQGFQEKLPGGGAGGGGLPILGFSAFLLTSVLKFV